jgi:hypothetical protein
VRGYKASRRGGRGSVVTPTGFGRSKVSALRIEQLGLGPRGLEMRTEERNLNVQPWQPSDSSTRVQ